MLNVSFFLYLILYTVHRDRVFCSHHPGEPSYCPRTFTLLGSQIYPNYASYSWQSELESRVSILRAQQ